MSMILQQCFHAGQEFLLEKLQTTESEKLLHMEDILKKHVIGQDEAIEAISTCNSNASHRAYRSK